MKRCAIYLRRSTDKQQQSIDDQRVAIEEYAEREGYEIVQTYTDDAISGADTNARKAFLEMVDAARAPERDWNYVLCFDVSRFSRSEADEAGYYRHVLSQAGVEVIYVAEGFRGDDTDDLVRATKQWLANRYVKDLSKVTIRGLVSRAEKGRWTGRPPYAYDLLYYDRADQPLHVVRYLAGGDREIRTSDGNTVTRVIPRGDPLPSGNDRAQLVPGDPHRVEIVQRIFEMYVHEQLGLASIAARLNAERVPSPGRPRKDGKSAGRWSPITIRDLIANPAYRGAVVWNRRSFAKFHKVADGHAVSRPKHRRKKTDANDPKDWITSESQHAPLVSPELWKRAQREREARAGTTTADQLRAGRGNSRYLLTGLVRCAHCGARWQGRKTTKGRKVPGRKRIETYHYACGGYIRQGTATCERQLVGQDELEDIVMQMAEEHLHEFVSTGGAALLAGLVHDETSGSMSEEAALKARLGADRARLEQLVECLTPDLVATLEPKILALRRQVEDAEARLRDIDQFRVTQDQARRWVEELVRDAAQIGDLMRSGTRAERKAILRGLTQEIVLDPKSGKGEVAFYGIPRVAGQKKTTRSEDHVVSSLVAGGGLFAEERTFEPGICRKAFGLRRANVAA